MAEPTTTAVIGTVAVASAASLAAANPTYHNLALILMASIAGGLVQLSTIKTDTRLQAAFYLISTSGMALALSGAIAWLLEKYASLPSSVFCTAVAFMIGVRREWVLSKIMGKIDNVAGDTK
ncbi:hypothetical protein UFOVP275_20 [uncultured Caudovirales phage]|uniref:Uncharacterized protein n=1 Tax=uncultured Caudovirales phage TaxID=2100421 RepID=A0A6J5LML4_9CAUD|nr:hypothetical protein UFOVP275_20 [uncultured Caudovirales phage]